MENGGKTIFRVAREVLRVGRRLNSSLNSSRQLSSNPNSNSQSSNPNSNNSPSNNSRPLLSRHSRILNRIETEKF